MTDRNQGPREVHTHYEKQIIQQACLDHKFYVYNKVEPTAYFWKELVAVNNDTPMCLVPDTLILNEKETELMWVYTNEQGRIAKDVNINFKDFVSKLTNYSSPNELVAILKRPISHEKLTYTNETKFMSARSLLNCSRQQIGKKDQTICIQRFIKSNGPQAFICRTIFCKHSSSTCFLITNKKEFFDKEDSEAKRLTARPQDRCRIVKSKQGKNLEETKEYLSRIVQYLLFHRGLEVSELVGDFIKDESGNWWLINIKGFKIVEKMGKMSKGAIVGSEMVSQEVEKERYQKTKLCRYCEKTYLESELTHRMTMRMIIEVDKYLLHLEKDYKWLKRSDIDNIDSNCLYQEHKVCERCYRLYTEIQLTMEMESRFTRKLGCQLEGSPKELIINQTNAEQLKQQAKAKEIYRLREGIPQVLELGPNSNIMIKDNYPIKNDEIINKMIRFRFIIYLNEIDEVPGLDPSLNYSLDFCLFGKKIKYKLDNFSPARKAIPLKKLKVIYFFTNSIDKMEDYAKTGVSLRINICTESKDTSDKKTIGYLELPIKDFTSSNTKKDFYKFFHLDNVPYGWGLEGSIGIIPTLDDVSTAKMIFKKSDGKIYLPSESYYFCEHLPEEWIDHIKNKHLQQNKQKEQSMATEKESFSNNYLGSNLQSNKKSVKNNENGFSMFQSARSLGESEESGASELWKGLLRKEIERYERGSRKKKHKNGRLCY